MATNPAPDLTLCIWDTAHQISYSKIAFYLIKLKLYPPCIIACATLTVAATTQFGLSWTQDSLLYYTPSQCKHLAEYCLSFYLFLHLLN